MIFHKVSQNFGKRRWSVVNNLECNSPFKVNFYSFLRTFFSGTWESVEICSFNDVQGTARMFPAYSENSLEIFDDLPTSGSAPSILPTRESADTGRTRERKY